MQHSSLHGTVLDQPQTAETARETLAAGLEVAAVHRAGDLSIVELTAAA